ncbi:MAG: pilus assembly protein PilP [Pseudomonadota bacterium]
MRDNLVSMRKNLTIIYIAVFILCLFHFITGCDDKNEPNKKAVAVSKKIVSKSNGPTSSRVQVPDVAAKTEIVDVSKIKNEISDKNANIKKEQTGTDSADVENSAKGNAKDYKASDITLKEIAKLQPEGIIIYNPEGKIDPFASLFKQGLSKNKGKKMRSLRTPLEMVDLSQLKLVAILRAESGNRALVEESSGKGYVVAKGTYIGNNYGRIVKILNDRIIVEEEIENIIGEKKIQERELKLQKPLGEE